MGEGPGTLSFIEALGVFKSERKKKVPKQVSEIAIFFLMCLIQNHFHQMENTMQLVLYKNILIHSTRNVS